MAVAARDLPSIGGRLAIEPSPCQSAARMNHPASPPKSATPIVIAVDGPAASGKGTIARALARHFGLPHMDTGMLYRAVALSMFRFGGDPGSEFEAVRACDGVPQIDPTDDELRSEVVSSIASRISAYPGVRAALLERQRHFAGRRGGAVLDGRDIGTVIAPDADGEAVRHRQRRGSRPPPRRELLARGMPSHYDDVLIDIRARDERDSGRDASPLAQAEDADLLDTSEMNIDEAIAAAIGLVEQRLALSRA